MGDIHLLGSNLHVIWLCPMFKVKFTSILLWIHNFRTPKLPLLKKFSDPTPPLSAIVSIWSTPPPPLVSFCQQLAYPPSPLRQLLSAFAEPPPPSPGWRNMWTAPKQGVPNVKVFKITFWYVWWLAGADYCKILQKILFHTVINDISRTFLQLPAEQRC